ncbi:MAG: SIMPL domain-containing protein [Candidatus Peregrinibacteria bacterium]
MEERTVYLRPAAWIPLLVVLIASGAYIGGKYLEKQDLQPVSISVDEEGKVSAVPDIAESVFGVQTVRTSSAQEAMKSLTTKMQAVIDAVKASGIEEKDISTESLSLAPQYDWKDGQQIPRGFQASEQLRVKIRDLDKIGSILTAVTSAGANQVGGVDFTIDDPESLTAMAREKAIAKGKAKAEVLAAQLGKTIKKLTGFSEGGGYTPPYPYRKANIMMDAAGVAAPEAAIPVPLGQEEIIVNVTLTYELR